MPNLYFSTLMPEKSKFTNDSVEINSVITKLLSLTLPSINNIVFDCYIDNNIPSFYNYLITDRTDFANINKIHKLNPLSQVSSINLNYAILFGENIEAEYELIKNISGIRILFLFNSSYSNFTSSFEKFIAGSIKQNTLTFLSNYVINSDFNAFSIMEAVYSFLKSS